MGKIDTVLHRFDFSQANTTVTVHHVPRFNRFATAHERYIKEIISRIFQWVVATCKNNNILCKQSVLYINYDLAELRFQSHLKCFRNRIE